MSTSLNKAELALELGKALTELRNEMRKAVQVKMREHNINLTFEMLEVLSYLWRKNGINQQEIADMTFKDKSSITYLIDNLAKRNLVTRLEDEKDRRNKLIFLTDEAAELKQIIFPWVNDMYAKASKDIETTDINLSLNTVNKMVSNLNSSTTV